MKTEINEEQKTVLVGYFDKGMTSKGKKCQEMHQSASEETGLEKNIILDWIGNHSRKVAGRKYTQKPVHTRGISGFNLFVSQNKEKLSSIKEWSSEWRKLEDEERNEYNQKASQIGQNIEENPNAEKVITKRLKSVLVDAMKCGLELAVVGFNSKEEFLTFGHGPIAEYFGSDGFDIVAAHLQTLATNKSSGNQIQVEKKDMKKKAQEHMNQLYAKAIGKNVPFPYKSVSQGKTLVDGFPEELLPIKPVSNYGEKKLKLILDTKEITVIPDNATTADDGLDSQVSPVAGTRLGEIHQRSIIYGPTSDDINDYDNDAPVAGTSTEAILEKLVVYEPTKDDIEDINVNCSNKLSIGDTVTLAPLFFQSDASPLNEVVLTDVVEPNLMKRKRTGKGKISSKVKPKRTKHEEDKEYDVEKVVDRRSVNGGRQYLIKWKGYPKHCNTWEPEENISKELVDSYII